MGTGCSYCKIGTYSVVKEGYVCGSSLIYQERQVGGQTKQCHAGNTDALCTDKQAPLTIIVEGVKNNATGELVDSSFQIAASIGGGLDAGVGTYIAPGKFQWVVQQNTLTSNDVSVGFSSGSSLNDTNCKKTFKRSASCSENACSTSPTGPTGPGTTRTSAFILCDQILDPGLKAQCQTCAGTQGQDGVWTAVDCISREPEDIARRLIQVR